MNNVALDRIDNNDIIENLLPNLLVQTDANTNLVSSNSVSAMSIGALTSTTINNSGTTTTNTLSVSGNSTTTGTATVSGNSYLNQIIMLPSDGNVGVINSHYTAPDLGANCLVFNVGGVGTGLALSSGGNIHINGDTAYKSAGISWTVSSDANLKENINDFTDGLDTVLNIRPRTFVYKSDAEKSVNVGIIAQELQPVYPNAISIGVDGYLKFDGNDFLFLLVNAIKDLKTIIDSQQIQINKLSSNSINNE
jgi:hypothetical protein